MRGPHWNLKKKDGKKDKKHDKKEEKKDKKHKKEHEKEHKKDKNHDNKPRKNEDHHKGQKHHGPPKHCMFKACFGFIFSLWGLFNLVGFYYHFGAIKCINNQIFKTKKSKKT